MSDNGSKFRPPPVPEAELAAIRAAIARRREAASLSPEALAEAAGLSRAAVRLIEGGQSSPALGTLYALAAALGCPVAELLGPATTDPAASGVPAQLQQLANRYVTGWLSLSDFSDAVRRCVAATQKHAEPGAAADGPRL